MTHTPERTCLELAKEENDYLRFEKSDLNHQANKYYKRWLELTYEIHSRRLHVFYTIIAMGLIGISLGIMLVLFKHPEICNLKC